MPRPDRIPQTMTLLGTFDNPKAGEPVRLPFGPTSDRGLTDTGGQSYQLAVDVWGERPTVWAAGRKPIRGNFEATYAGGGWVSRQRGDWASRGIKILWKEGNKWVQKRDFGRDTVREVLRATPPAFGRQRLYFDPVRESLYVGEDVGFWKSFDEAIVINPENGRARLQDLPFDCEDMAFDRNGRIYMRTDTLFVRFDPRTWREVPFDYGEERRRVHFQGFTAPRRAADAAAAVPIPGKRTTPWNMFGMGVNAKGRVAITCYIRDKVEKRNHTERGLDSVLAHVKSYQPVQYPGRCVPPAVIHIFDERGKPAVEDAVPGLFWADGIGLDARGDLYVLVSAPAVIGGKRSVNGATETLVKCRPGVTRLLSASGAPVPLPEDKRPKRPADLTRYGIGKAWIENAEWTYSGIGYGGFPAPCVCWHCRFALDDFARSFAPETDRYSVAVLDTNGNLILRLGRYGNVDDGVPLDPKGGPPNPRSIGGDEVALFHCAYPGVDTDRRLFLSDTGNGRILSVKLDYHANAVVALRDVKDNG